MDVFVLVGSFTVLCLAGMPVAYALGLAAILAALWTGIPLEAVMLKVSGGMSGFSLLAIPFFILAGAIMAVGGMAERLVNLAKVCERYGGGGHARVGAISFPTSHGEEARKAALEIVAELRASYREQQAQLAL